MRLHELYGSRSRYLFWAKSGACRDVRRRFMAETLHSDWKASAWMRRSFGEKTGRWLMNRFADLRAAPGFVLVVVLGYIALIVLAVFAGG
jgi:hypothetical protein